METRFQIVCVDTQTEKTRGLNGSKNPGAVRSKEHRTIESAMADCRQLNARWQTVAYEYRVIVLCQNEPILQLVCLPYPGKSQTWIGLPGEIANAHTQAIQNRYEKEAKSVAWAYAAEVAHDIRHAEKSVITANRPAWKDLLTIWQAAKQELYQEVRMILYGEKEVPEDWDPEGHFPYRQAATAGMGTGAGENGVQDNGWFPEGVTLGDATPIESTPISVAGMATLDTREQGEQSE